MSDTLSLDDPYLSKYLTVNDTISSSLNLPLGINPHRIVLIGDQSSGKSSIIERISGVKIPRNHGGGTLAPLQISLCKSKEGEDEFCRIKYGDDPDTNWMIIDFNQTNYYIRKFQDQLIEANNVKRSNKLICLEVHKKSLTDLTIIDLPGITPINQETENIVKEMVKDYIKQSNTIVLFAHNSCIDFEVNFCARLIMDVSETTPDIFNRTIPVLTKIDTTFTEHLVYIVNSIINKYKFKYAPIMVKNSNEGNEINTRVNSNQEHDKDNENQYYNDPKNYFENVSKTEEIIIKKHLQNSTLRRLCSKYQGINGLIKLLIEIERTNLQNSKNNFKSEIMKTLNKYEREKENIPKPITDKNKSDEIDEKIKKLEECIRILDNIQREENK